MTIAERMHVDFFIVAPEHAKIHARLENWARWCNGSRGERDAAPGFEGYQSGAKHWYGHDVSVPVDRLDAQRMAKAVAELPPLRRRAVGWCYVTPYSPRRAARELGVDMATLCRLVEEGRQALIDRDV